MLKGGWWWKSCGRGLNGLYLNDPQDLTARQGNIKYLIFLYLQLSFKVIYCSLKKNLTNIFRIVVNII